MIFISHCRQIYFNKKIINICQNAKTGNTKNINSQMHIIYTNDANAILSHFRTNILHSRMKLQFQLLMSH